MDVSARLERTVRPRSSSNAHHHRLELADAGKEKGRAVYRFRPGCFVRRLKLFQSPIFEN